MELVRKRTKGDEIHIRSKWFSFYPKWDNLSYIFSPYSYFDLRFYIAISGIPLLTVILLPLITFHGWWIALLGLIIPWGKFYIHLPIYADAEEGAEYPQYGFYLYRWDSKGAAFTQLVVCKGRKSKYIEMPWAYQWVRTSYLKGDGEWETETRKGKTSLNSWDDKWKGIWWEEKHPYVYKLESGEIQNRTATIRVEEREWRPLWFLWTNLFSRIRKTISVDFDKEVGERAGSWKGGVTGCGYSILPNEEPVDALRRMERGRVFK